MARTAKSHGVVRSAGVVSAAIGVSRISGLVREMVMARLFGAGAVYDAFLLGFRIPNLTRDLFAEGALSSAFVPVFTQYLSTKGRREAAELASLLATALLFVVGGICALGMVFSPRFVGLLAPGFEQVPGKFGLAVTLTRIMFPYLLLVTLAAQAMGILNACNRFGVPALASTCFNVGSVAFGLAFGFTLAPRLGLSLIEAMAYGIVFGGLMQLLWQVPSLVREGLLPRPRLDWSHPGLRRVMSLIGPAILGNAAVQINVMVNTNFASGIRDAAGHVIDGPVSWLGYAFRFMQLPLGLFGVAIASATLPAISRSAALGRMEEFRRTLSRSLGMIFLLTVPSSVGLAVLGESMIAAVYQGGRFTPADTHQTALALSCYALGLAGYAGTKLLAPAFYALGDARTPMLVSVFSVFVNLGAAYAMVRKAGIGHVGLALSTSLVAMFGAAALLAVLRLRIGGIGGRELTLDFVKIAAASGGMGAVCLASSHALRQWLGTGKFAQLANVTVSIPLGVIVFAMLARALHAGGTEDAWRAVQRATLRFRGCPPI